MIVISILSEYEAIRKRIGEEKYYQIENFLKNHPHYYLSDVYYRESVWNEMEEWTKNNQEENIVIKHEETIRIAASEFDRINRLLAIESLEEMTDEELIEQGANTDYCEGIFYVEFDNGASLNFDLCSGMHNYWDDVVWTSADGTTDVVLDCEYGLSDIEVEVDNELYIVKVIKE